MIGRGQVRDQHLDYLLEKVFIPAFDVVKNVASLTGTNIPVSLSVGFSIGSPSYVSIPSGRIGGVLFTAVTPTIDYYWRVPSAVDKNHPIYFRHHWTTLASGLTPSISYNMWFVTLSVGSILTGTPTSPTTVINTAIPLSSNSTGAGAPWGLNITGRGAIAPLATGLAANQILQDTVEALQLVFQPGSVNFGIGANNVIWLGMDIEYTSRKTFGDGSRLEGRKMETNLGFGEVGAVNNY